MKLLKFEITQENLLNSICLSPFYEKFLNFLFHVSCDTDLLWVYPSISGFEAESQPNEAVDTLEVLPAILLIAFIIVTSNRNNLGEEGVISAGFSCPTISWDF